MAKIAIDITPTKNLNQYRGVGVYTKNLITRVQEIDQANEYIFYTRGQKLPKVDLVHYPYFDFFFLTLPFFKKFPTIITIYDVIPFIFQKESKPGFKGILKLQIQKFLLKNIDRIITISQCSKKDVQNYLAVAGNKIDVTYLAAAPIFKPIADKKSLEKVGEKYNLPQKFILYVGDVNFNKNLPRLFEAIAKISIPLVMIGQAAKNEKLVEVGDLMRLAEKLGIEKNVIRLGFVQDVDLVSIYNLAVCYAQPSLYEGFGLPALEAMACGAPVACSDIAVHREIAGDIPFYFDPNNPDDIAKILRSVVSLSNLNHQSRVERGLKQVKKYSWEKTIRKTIEVYQKTLFS